MNSKTGKVPIYLRVILNREKAETRLNEEISLVDLRLWNPFTMGMELLDSALNKTLNAIESKYDEFKVLNTTKLDQFTAKQVRDILVCNNIEKIDVKFTDYLILYIQKSVREKQELQSGTKKTITDNHILIQFLSILSETTRPFLYLVFFLPPFLRNPVTQSFNVPFL